jgi:hypothetical protein
MLRRTENSESGKMYTDGVVAGLVALPRNFNDGPDRNHNWPQSGEFLSQDFKVTPLEYNSETLQLKSMFSVE